MPCCGLAMMVRVSWGAAAVVPAGTVAPGPHPLVVPAALCQARPVGVHVVSGDDPSLISSAVTELVHRLVGDGDRTLMVDEFDGDEYEVRAVVDAAQTPPFLTERRVVVARGVGRFTADDVAPLVAYLGDPLDTTDLVLVAGGGRLPKSFLDAVKKAGAAPSDTAPPSRPKDRSRVDRRAGRRRRPAPRPGGESRPAPLARRGRRPAVRRCSRRWSRPTAPATAARRRRRAVPRRGRRRAAVGADRRHRPGRHGTALRALHRMMARRRSPPAAADGDPPQPLRPAAAPRRLRGQRRGERRELRWGSSRVPGPEGARSVPPARPRRGGPGHRAAGRGRSRPARRQGLARVAGDGGAGGPPGPLACRPRAGAEREGRSARLATARR